MVGRVDFIYSLGFVCFTAYRKFENHGHPFSFPHLCIYKHENKGGCPFSVHYTPGVSPAGNVETAWIFFASA